MDQLSLIQGIKDKNPEAQKELVHLFAPYLFSVSIRYARDESEAKDILQDSFINVFKSFDSFSGAPNSLKYWMRRIVINNALKKYRASSYTNESYPENLKDDNFQNPMAYSHLGVDEILKLLEQLPADQQKVFNLFVIDGYNHKDIADLLQIKITTCRSLLSRARKAMQLLITKINEHEAKAI